MKSEASLPVTTFRCDCVKLKRAIQAKIYEETKYMTPEEQRERLRQVSERAATRRKELAGRRVAEKQM